MRLRAPPLEKAIRSLARDELRSSPALLGEFNRRRRGRLVDRFATMAVWSCGIGVFVFALLVASFAPKESPFPGEQNGAEWLLVAVALVGSGYSLFAAGGSGTDPGTLTSLALHAALHYPVRDRELMARSARFWAVGVFVFTAAGVWFVSSECITSNRPLAWGYQAAVGTSLLQTALATALFLYLNGLPEEHPLRGALGLLGFLVFAAGTVMVIVAARRGDMPDWLTCATFLFCPLGWAHGVLYWGVIRGQPAAYLLLAPAVATLGVLVLWIRREDRSDDVFFEPDVLAKMALGSADDGPKRRRQTVVGLAQQPCDRMPAARATRRRKRGSTEAIERGLLEGGWLRGEWVPAGPVDQIALVVLTPRERLLVECLHRGRSVLTWQWVVMLVLLVLGGHSYLFGPPGEGSARSIPAAISLWWGVVALLSLPAMSGYHVLFPVGFHEVSRTILKVGLMKCLCWLPLTVGFSLAVASRLHVPFLSAVSLGLLPVIVYVAWLPVSACMVFEPVIVEARARRIRVVEVICGAFALVASLFFLAPLGVWRVVFAAVLFLATGTIWFRSARAFRRSAPDGPA